MKPLAVLIPKGIGVEDLVNTYSPKLDIDYLKYLIHLVLSRLSLIIENEKAAYKAQMEIFDTYIPIYSRRLLVSTKKHREHIRFLGQTFIDKVNIFFRKDYSKGKSYSYKLSPHYESKQLEVEYLDSKSLSRKVIESMTNINPVVKHNSGKYHFLYKYFNSKHLTIDMDRAKAFSKHRYAYFKDYKKHLKEMTIITELYNGIYRIYYNKKTDARIHTNLSILPKVYRKFIKYKGKRLIEVDLSNSIIYFLAMIVNNKTQQTNLNKTFPLLYIFTKTLERVNLKEKELLLDLALSGEFYDDFIEAFKKRYSLKKYRQLYYNEFREKFAGSYEQQRNFAKKRLLAMLFADIDDYKTEQVIFNMKFPKLHEAIRVFKRKKGYRRFSHLLMQIESHYMLDVAARAFNKKYYRVAPTFTLHDCLITTEDYQDELKNTMKEVFEKEFGTAPNFKVKEW